MGCVVVSLGRAARLGLVFRLVWGGLRRGGRIRPGGFRAVRGRCRNRTVVVSVRLVGVRLGL